MTLITNKTLGHCDELVEQAATGLATCHSRVPVAHSFGVFFYTFFSHGHGWRHGVPIYEATRLHFPNPEFFSVSASMRQHGYRHHQKLILAKRSGELRSWVMNFPPKFADSAKSQPLGSLFISAVQRYQNSPLLPRTPDFRALALL